MVFYHPIKRSEIMIKKKGNTSYYQFYTKEGKKSIKQYYSSDPETTITISPLTVLARKWSATSFKVPL